MAESSFRQAMLLSRGSLTIFWSNGLVGSIMTLGVVLAFWPVISWLVGSLRTAKPA
jgi:putative tricarboxylic transport membrane protein